MCRLWPDQIPDYPFSHMANNMRHVRETTINPYSHEAMRYSLRDDRPARPKPRHSIAMASSSPHKGYLVARRPNQSVKVPDQGCLFDGELSRREASLAVGCSPLLADIFREKPSIFCSF